MEPLIIHAEKQTPEILIDFEAGIIKMNGNSYPEDSSDIYQPVIDYIKMYQDEITKIDCELNFEFLNSNSHKMIFDILLLLMEIHEQGKAVNVIWKYEDIDEDMMEMGEDMASLVDLPMQLVPF